MRIVDRVHSDSSSLESDTRQEHSGSLAGADPACEGPQSGNKSPQLQSASNASRHPIVTATSWLVPHLIEGFAPSSEAIYPNLVDLAELIDDPELERDSRRRCQAQVECQSEPLWLRAIHPRKSEDSERSAKAQTTPPGLNARVSSVVTRFWAKMPRERRARPTIAKLEAFDDRTLKDIGIHRC
jgi:uncharacterized protein YjiS (DUF1127 family)